MLREREREEKNLILIDCGIRAIKSTSDFADGNKIKRTFRSIKDRSER